MPRFSNRIAVVTGAGFNNGEVSLGRAIATVFGREGATVAVIDVDGQAAALMAAEIEASGGSSIGVRCDVANEAECSAAAADIAGRYGRIDVLVNNVGTVGAMGSIETFDRTDWDQTFAVNATSMFLMAKHCVSAMPEGAAIVNISSIAAIQPGLGTAYGPSKAAVESLTRAMATQFGSRGIRANAVSPGPIWTEMVARMVPEAAREQVRESRRSTTALDIEGTAWDCANAVAFLASDEARWITGQVLTVDGGTMLYAGVHDARVGSRRAQQ